MKNCFLFIALLFFFLSIHGQTTRNKGAYDEKYLEDQFYLGLGYNFLLDKPETALQRSLSYNFQLGFIKDIPLNRERNFGFGLGIGYATNSYYSNIVATKVADDEILYDVLNSDEFKRSKLEIHAVEFPLELRWRNSDSQTYKFWRVYAGARLGYVFGGRSRLVTAEGSDGFSNPDIQDLQYGFTLSFGFNTWNIHAYYALNPLLEDGTSLDTGETIDFKVLRIGLIFYIL